MSGATLGVGGSRCHGRMEVLREDTTEVGVTAEEEEVREGEEGHARPKRVQNRRRRWYLVVWRLLFLIFVPPKAHRRAEGR